MAEPRLTPKQEAFVLAYVETGNASEAYRRAYDAERMKPTTIKRNAQALLKHNTIAATIAQRQRVVAERSQVTAEMIARRAWEIAEQDDDRRASVSALALLSKRHPEFSEKHQVTGADGGPVIVERRTRGIR